MEYPISLYYETDVSDIKTLDLCRGNDDYRKVHIVDDGQRKLVIKYLSTDVRRIVAMIKPFSDAKNLKIATALYQLTIHSEDAYTTVAQISDKSGVSPEKVQDCLESDLSQFILEKEGRKVSSGLKGCI